MFNSLRHLLPRTPLWSVAEDKNLRTLMQLIGNALDPIRTYFDKIFFDMFPETTRQLNAWDAVQGVHNYSISEEDRRSRFAGWLRSMGGQSPQYIQDVLQASGFNLYVYDSFYSNVPDWYNPRSVLWGEELGCGDNLLECGQDEAECGNYAGSNGYALVNKLYVAGVNYSVLCGEDEAACGQDEAECGNFIDFYFDRITYPLPDEPEYFPYFLYIGAATFGEMAYVMEERREELEDLLLRICPQHLWIGMLVGYEAGNIFEDESGDFLFEDESGSLLVEA